MLHRQILVSYLGGTLRANNLREVEEIMQISSRLVVNQAALKLKRELLQPVIEAFAGAMHSMSKPLVNRSLHQSKRFLWPQLEALLAFEAALDSGVQQAVTEDHCRYHLHTATQHCWSQP